MAFLEATPFVKEESQREYFGDGLTRNYRDRLTITVVYACDEDGHDSETIPATRNTAIESPGTTCDLVRVSNEINHGDATGHCVIIYEDVTDWALVT